MVWRGLPFKGDARTAPTLAGTLLYVRDRKTVAASDLK
jgi:hypothetical protein